MFLLGYSFYDFNFLLTTITTCFYSIRHIVNIVIDVVFIYVCKGSLTWCWSCNLMWPDNRHQMLSAKHVFRFNHLTVPFYLSEQHFVLTADGMLWKVWSVVSRVRGRKQETSNVVMEQAEEKLWQSLRAVLSMLVNLEISLFYPRLSFTDYYVCSF